MTTNAFIFARGGSKGLPGKNIKNLCGKPLIQYSIELAKKIEFIENVFVSTDDLDISIIAKKNGAVIIDRPKELAEDDSPEWMSWKHGVEWVQEKYGPFDNFISLPSTSPLRSEKDVRQALEKFNSCISDVCLAVTPSSRSPYFNMIEYTKGGFIKRVSQQGKDIVRRQDAPLTFDVTTVVYVTTPRFILNHNALFDGKVVAIEVPKKRAIDIDDIYDFYLAEAIIKEQVRDAKK
ncbi:MAG: acylneuraminate cytidylyltransferase family protein [Cellvibrionaceae bacterium]